MGTDKNKIQFNDPFFLRKLVLVYAQKWVRLSILFLFILSSCETVIEIDLPVEKPRLVVNSIFNADSILNVNVTKSRPTNVPGLDFEKVENAVVEVHKNQQSIGLLTYSGKGNYRASAKFPNEPYAEYSLKIKAAGLETAIASEIIPGKPIISSLEADPDNSNSNSTYKSYKTLFTLHDANETNFYFLRTWLVHENGNKRPISFGLNNILGQFVPQGMAGVEMVVFEDRSFNGKAVTFDIDLFQVYIGNSGKYRILIELGSTNKSYFDYQYSVKRQFSNIPVFGPENLPITNNIKNGLGIFAAYNAATVSFEVKR